MTIDSKLECSIKCGGDCCRGSPLSITNKDLQAARFAHVCGKRTYVNEAGRGAWMPIDLEIMGEMLVYLGVHEKSPVSGEPYDNGPREVFTCIHLDREKGECTNYLGRPQMCRDYPDHNECEYPGCRIQKTVMSKRADILSALVSPFAVSCLDEISKSPLRHGARRAIFL